jgi:hypothetical protein
MEDVAVITIIVVITLVAFLAMLTFVGFYRGWFHLAATPTESKGSFDLTRKKEPPKEHKTPAGDK